MKPVDIFLMEIQENPMFPSVIEKLKQGRPVIPEFDSTQNNTDEWKQKSGMKRGYDLALAKLNIKLGD